MLCAQTVWSWCFHVGEPEDPKLRGWLHPAFALALNLGLAFAVAFAAFISAPFSFHQEWLQRQPGAVVLVVHAVHHALNGAHSLGVHIRPVLQWVNETLGRALLSEEAIFDKKQAFALYSWEGSMVGPQHFSGLLLAYVTLMLTCRLCEKGPVMLYDMAWACNMSMVLAAAVDQLLWYADLVSLLVRGRFLIGVAKYIVNKNTPWTKKLFSTHHLWFIPLTTYINLKHAAGHSPCCLSVSLALSIACVLGSRCCTPYEVSILESSSQSTEPPRKSLSQGKDEREKGCTAVLNVNVSWRCWADVAHHVPLLGICDDKSWYLFVAWNQLVWGLGNCLLFGILLAVVNLFRIDN